MKEATVSELTVSELQAGLSGYLERVKAGEELVVTEDGKPVARVVPVNGNESDVSDYPGRADLIKRGIIRPAKAKLPADFWDRPMPEDPEGLVLKYLLEDREKRR